MERRGATPFYCLTVHLSENTEKMGATSFCVIVLLSEDMERK